MFRKTPHTPHNPSLTEWMASFFPRAGMQVIRFRNASIPAVECLHFMSGLLAFRKGVSGVLVDDAVLPADVVGDVGRQQTHVASVAHRKEGGFLGEEPTGEGA